MKRKIFLLDLGGVVFQSIGISNDTVNWDIIFRLNEIYGPRMDLGEPVFLEFLKEYNKITDQQLESQDFFKELFDTLDFNLELIEFLKCYGDIIIVSDNYPENIEYIAKRYNFERWSIAQYYSFTYKMHKANPDFFATLLKDLSHYDIKDLIFIDDSITKLESASKSFIKGIHYINNNQVKAIVEKTLNKG